MFRFSDGSRRGWRPPSDVVWRKHLGLLAYLALSRGLARSREHLLGICWPEKPAARARHSLNEAVRRLRVCLGAGRLLSEGESIRLSDGGLDVEPYSEAAASLLLRARALAGDATGALSTFRDLREHVSLGLGEEPGRELKALAERVRSRRWRRASPA